MNPRIKSYIYIIVGSIFAVLTIIYLYRLVVANQLRQDFFNIGEQEQEEATQEMLNSMDEKCIDNPDFLYCNNN